MNREMQACECAILLSVGLVECCSADTLQLGTVDASDRE